MQLSDEVKAIELLSDEELRKMLTTIRNNRLQAPEKVKKAERKKTKDTQSSLDKLLSGMSPEKIKELLAKTAK